MISVIIPVYNGEKTIDRCLESILNQTYEGEYEIIVVDDGSVDKTREMVIKYPVKLLSQVHKGPAAARNFGAENSEGNILLFIDSDCIPDKNWIKEMVKPFRNEEIVGVQGRYKTMQKELIAKFVQYEIEERYERMAKRKYIDFIGSYSAAYKRDVFLQEKFDESFPIASGEDPDLSFRLVSKGYKMMFNPKAIVYHNHPDTLMKYLKQKFYRAFWRVPLYRKNYKKIIKESYTPQLLKVQIWLFYLLILSITISTFSRDLYIPLTISIMLLLTTLPLSFEMYRKDRKVGLISPIVIILRTIVFGLGLVYGMIKK